MEKITGEIYENLNSFFEWKIENFASLSTEPGECYESPPFDFFSATWCLVIYPNGCYKDYSNHLSMFLKKLSCKESNHVVFFKISIKKNDGTDYVNKEGDIKFSKGNESKGWYDFTKRSDLLEEINSIEIGGNLTISCSVKWNHCVSVAPSENVPAIADATPPEPNILWKSLVRNMKDSFLKQKNCDVVIKVKEEDFSAHRMILESRSTVFEAMFEHDMSENRNCVLEISDTEPGIFRDFLLYLYCGEVEKKCSDKVYGLYALADKYDTEDLKQECVKFMECSVCLETVCDVLLLAEKYDEKQLNELAKSFVLKNANAVLSSDQWKKLELQNYLLANQILKSVVLDKASKLK